MYTIYTYICIQISAKDATACAHMHLSSIRMQPYASIIHRRVICNTYLERKQKVNKCPNRKARIEFCSDFLVRIQPRIAVCPKTREDSAAQHCTAQYIYIYIYMYICLYTIYVSIYIHTYKIYM